MSGDHNEHHIQVEIPKTDDHLNLAFELGYETAKRDGGLRFPQEEMNELIQALEESVYLLDPTEEDMQKKAGVYRIVTALEKLKERTHK